MNNINGEVSCVNLCETKKIIKKHNQRDNVICLEKKIKPIFYQRVIVGLPIQNQPKNFGAFTETDYNL